jgi:hypothetical protein
VDCFGASANVCLPPPSCCAAQAKTTKKIVLRMQCQECKQTCMKGLKVGTAPTASGTVRPSATCFARW